MVDNILKWCKAVIATTPARWYSIVEAFPAELLAVRPLPVEWSAVECLQHLVEVEQFVYPVRLNALLTGQPFPGFNPPATAEEVESPPMMTLVQTFDKARQANLALLGQVTEADLDREALHGEYGRVSMRQFLHHWTGHDLMHMVQAERAMLQPFIQGCGPWDVNYTDHIAVTKVNT